MHGNIETVQQALMRAVIDRIGREHLLLKGGTALIFGYNIPRISDDLDFDANRPVRGIVKKLQEIDVPNVKIVAVDTTKDTSTTQRYRVRYLVNGSDDVQKLKIELSYRQPFDEHKDVTVIDGIRFASLPRLIDQKIQAAFDGKDPRTASRDLFDLDFLASNHPEAFSLELAERLADFTKDPSLLYATYEQAFEEEDLGLTVDQFEELVLRIAENSRQILKRVSERSKTTSRSNHAR